MKKKTIGTILIFAAILMSSCDKDKEETVVGYKPVYATASELERINTSENEPLENPGKIHIYNDYLLVNDKAKGIHIYDNSNNTNPTEISFISIPGNMDFSVREGILYADNITDMVVIDISQPSKPEYKNRIKNVFPIQQSPDQAGPFECVDSEKGMVIRWEKATLINPKCSK